MSRFCIYKYLNLFKSRILDEICRILNPQCIQQYFRFEMLQSFTRILIKIWQNLLNLESRLHVVDPLYFLWNVTDDDTVDSTVTYCNNILIFGIFNSLLQDNNSLTQESILYCTRSDLRRSFWLLFPYCTRVVKISAQKYV